MTDRILSISVCIATHERAFLIGSTLYTLASQSRLPDEVVISDSSNTQDTFNVVEKFQKENPELVINYVHSENKALPWHRWWGFKHSQGEIVLFIDDDITLASKAIEMLENTYIDLFTKFGVDEIAGVGLKIFLDDGTSKGRRPESLEEKWLNIVKVPSGTITNGGQDVPPAGLQNDTLLLLGRLSGGAMSFSRKVLEQIGLLDRLVDLYNASIGKGEDTVLSYYAGKRGQLFMLTNRLAIHPSDERAVQTAEAKNGWYKGLRETWGRAHTMWWMASDMKAFWTAWFRVATFEVICSIWFGMLRHPLAKDSWARFGGALYGTFLTIGRFKKISSSARS